MYMGHFLKLVKDFSTKLKMSYSENMKGLFNQVKMSYSENMKNVTLALCLLHNLVPMRSCFKIKVLYTNNVRIITLY